MLLLTAGQCPMNLNFQLTLCKLIQGGIIHIEWPKGHQGVIHRLKSRSNSREAQVKANQLDAHETSKFLNYRWHWWCDWNF
eukprot:Skav209528  [mRNA]  locus=scaffold2767:422285:422527:+ [translate_table: standard]